MNTSQRVFFQNKSFKEWAEVLRFRNTPVQVCLQVEDYWEFKLDVFSSALCLIQYSVVKLYNWILKYSSNVERIKVLLTFNLNCQLITAIYRPLSYLHVSVYYYLLSLLDMILEKKNTLGVTSKILLLLNVLYFHLVLYTNVEDIKMCKTLDHNMF